MAQLLDGKALANSILNELKNKIAFLQKQVGIAPGLAILQVSGDAASDVYIKHKLNTAKKIGVEAKHYLFSSGVAESDIAAKIEELNKDPQTHGILLQLPLPKHFSPLNLINAIDPKKDVDGLTASNLGGVLQNQKTLQPCTPIGILRLLTHYEIPLLGQEVVIINASQLVGKPLSLKLLNAGSTVTICHSKSLHIPQHLAQADIVISAIGKPNIIKSEWLQPGIVAIDVGIHRQMDGTLRGDFDFLSAAEKASWITPVPGGVGPMTVASLMENLLQAFQQFSV